MVLREQGGGWVAGDAAEGGGGGAGGTHVGHSGVTRAATSPSPAPLLCPIYGRHTHTHTHTAPSSLPTAVFDGSVYTTAHVEGEREEYQVREKKRDTQRETKNTAKQVQRGTTPKHKLSQARVS